MRLQLCQRRGLQIIVPRNFNSAEAINVLQKHRKWIEHTWKRIQPRLVTTEPEIFPKQLQLLAINKTWQVYYQPSKTNVLTVYSIVEQQLTLIGKTESKRLVQSVVLKWLHKIAKNNLIPWLEQLSLKTGLSYTRASIRHNKTRWGSCSAKKQISLDCKLLFLPPAMAEYVLLHELCHTVHLNHSKAFWGLLKSLNPDCHELRKQLKRASQYIPDWLE